MYVNCLIRDLKYIKTYFWGGQKDSRFMQDICIYWYKDDMFLILIFFLFFLFDTKLFNIKSDLMASTYRQPMLQGCLLRLSVLYEDFINLN